MGGGVPYLYLTNNMYGYGLRELTSKNSVCHICIMTPYPAFFICISSRADFPFKLAKAHSLGEVPAGHT
jgi:hypothetical protein